MLYGISIFYNNSYCRKWRMMTFRFLSKLKESTSNIERFADSTRGHSNKINLETGRNSLAAEDNEIDNKQQPETGNTKESLKDVVLIFQESLPAKDEDIVRSSELKSFESIKNDVIPGFGISQHLVKPYSRPNGLPHLVFHAENNLIKCDANCPRYNSGGFCSPCIAVALKLRCLKSLPHDLEKFRSKNITQLASQKINKNTTGQKLPARMRKSLIGSPKISEDKEKHCGPITSSTGEEIPDRKPQKIILNKVK